MRSLLQFSLDFLGLEPRVPPAAIQPAPAPHFTHPRASRELLLGQTRVAYEFKRGKRRTIGFSVGPQGLSVSAPKWVSLPEVEAALREKADWIFKKLGQAQERQALLESRHIEWRDGVCLPFKGEAMAVVLTPDALVELAGGRRKSRAVSAVLQRAPAPECGVEKVWSEVPALRLQLGLPISASPEQIRDAVQAWLLLEARRVFSERLNHFAARLQVQWHKLTLSNAGTRWGSAKSDGAIRLHWRLIHFKPDVIDYVVAHELCHLRVMDHSPRFWATVQSVIPDYAVLRTQLKEESLPRWQ